MKRRWRQHVNPLTMTSLVPCRGPLKFPDGVEVEVELGCGNARYLMELAQMNPDRLYIGLDIRKPFLAAAQEELDRTRLPNLQLEVCNLIVDSSHLFTPASILRFHINFPDPWFKRRHLNRRWLTSESLGHLVAALRGRGQIFFQSDVWSVALEAMALMEEHPELENTCGEWTFLRQNPFRTLTSREAACIEEGRRIWRMLFSRKHKT